MLHWVSAFFLKPKSIKIELFTSNYNGIFLIITPFSIMMRVPSTYGADGKHQWCERLIPDETLLRWRRTILRLKSFIYPLSPTKSFCVTINLIYLIY